VYVDAENTLDEEWATLLGVDVAALILMRPQEQSAEQVLQDMLDLMATGLVIMMVLDSVPMLVSQKLLKPDSTLEDKAYGGIADTLAEFSRKASSLISRNHIALILINQLREDLNNPYNQYKTPGGRALKHFFALRLYFRKGDFFDDKGAKLKQSAETPAGNLVDVHVVKTKVCKPDRRIGYYTLSYTDGVDVIGDTIDMAIKYDLIVQSGAWFRLINEDGEILEGPDGEELKFQGRPALLEYLRDDSEIFDELYDAVLERLK
jgi:recombination protein RecA